MKHFHIFLFSLFVVLYGCETHHDDHHHDMEEHAHHDDQEHQGSNIVSLDVAQAQAVGIVVEYVKKQPFCGTIYTTGQVMPTNDAAWQVVAKSSGVVRFCNNSSIVGCRVAKGQKLMNIDNSMMPDDNIQVKKQEALAAYEASKADYERKQSLLKEQLVTKSDAEQAKQNYLSNKARYDNLCSNTTANGTSVVSPASGYIRDLVVANGQYVTVGQTLATITKGNQYVLQAQVPQQYYRELRNIAGATFQDPSSQSWHDIGDYHGKVLSYGQSLAAHSGMLSVTFAIDNGADLLDGAFVKMFIKVGSVKDCISVPNGGIVEELGAYFVFVQLDDDCYEKRLVQIGSTDGVRTVVESGLQEGERVVTCNAIMLKLSQGTGTVDPHAGHVH